MDVITYFGEERIQNLFCIFLGALSVIFSLIFLCIIKYSFYKGMAIPLLVFGILQLTAGAFVFTRTPKDLARVEQLLQQHPEKVETEELIRMKTIQKNFELYQCIEIALILCGLILYTRFYRSSSTFWKGLGMGLVLQASVILTLDTIAEKRAEQYTQYLTGLKKIIAPLPSMM